ncbi:MAG: lipopolysaccharide biosynthesis protein [Candidatus Vecturithrix sp.]|nr:lipopolysaccharide biosynthesis protein [Candidatus Vecturithrix sp.]
MQKYQHIFDTTHLQSDLKQRSLRSGAITLTSQALQFVIQLGSTMVLARILSPEDYGMNAMAVAITGFAAIFSNLGLSSSTIQRAEINHEQVSTLFWINIGVGLLLTLVVAAISPAVAWFYKLPELLWVMLSLSVVFSITGLSVQHSALLTRQMRFYTLAKIRVISMLAGIFVAIAAGYNGLGYWALVLNTLTSAVVQSAGCWLACRWVPGLPQRSAGIASMVKFGADLVSFDVINYFARNLDNILIGRYHGSGALGLYSKAYQLLMMPITNLRVPLNGVAMPALSRLQNEPEMYRIYYKRLLSILSFVSIPLVAFMLVCSDRIIHLILGSQWMEASVLFKILALAGLVETVSSTTGMVLITSGQSRRYLWVGAAGSLIICLAFVFGLPWGAKGVATAYAVANYLILLPTLIYAYKDTPVQLGDFFMAIYRPFLASLAMAAVCFALLRQLDNWSDLVALAVCFVASLLVYVLFTIVIANGAQDLREFYSYGRLVFTQKKPDG